MSTITTPSRPGARDGRGADEPAADAWTLPPDGTRSELEEEDDDDLYGDDDDDLEFDDEELDDEDDEELDEDDDFDSDLDV